MSRLWDKGGDTNALALRFTVGDDHLLDTKLLPWDLQGTRAHVACLAASNLLNAEEASKINQALDELLAEHQRGKLAVQQEQEDCHTAIEARLTEKLGDLGAMIHAGRSRNDQVVTMTRLALRDACAEIAAQTAQLAEALCMLAERYPAQALAGYTHLQRAMPSSVAAWALGYAEVLCERAESLCELRSRLARSALGSAAGYGTPIKLDRNASAQAQGYPRVQAVTSVQLTRGLDELCFCQELSTLGVVISRMAADLVLYATKEFAFAKLPAELTTGSSIMPNKANPDLFELLRARANVLTGYPAQISAVLGGLPGGYQRDLQLIKRFFITAWEEATLLLEAGSLAISGVHFDQQTCDAAMAAELYATAYAYQLVRQQGMPFREAYRVAAKSPDQWKPGLAEAGSESADNVEYTRGLLSALRTRLAEVDSSKSEQG